MTGLFKNKEKTVGKVVALDVGLIIPNRSQPRVTFDENELAALSASIRENGILQPINVRRCGVNYEIISGERRFRAAKICGLEEVPCIVIDADDELVMYEEALTLDELSGHRAGLFDLAEIAVTRDRLDDARALLEGGYTFPMADTRLLDSLLR